MDQRVELHDLLVDILESSNVYFQPPPDVKMQYPCIVYHRDSLMINHANDLPYNKRKRYQVTVIDQNPDSEIPDRISDLPLCNYERFFTADNLNHDVFNLYF